MEKEIAKILVVDDEADIRKILRLLLQKKGYEVLEASNGISAVEEVLRDDIDLVIMDIMMPQMSGIDACVEIRKISTVPILFLTAKSLVSDKERAYMSGGDDYLVKPFSSAEREKNAQASGVLCADSTLTSNSISSFVSVPPVISISFIVTMMAFSVAVLFIV